MLFQCFCFNYFIYWMGCEIVSICQLYNEWILDFKQSYRYFGCTVFIFIVNNFLIRKLNLIFKWVGKVPRYLFFIIKCDQDDTLNRPFFDLFNELLIPIRITIKYKSLKFMYFTTLYISVIEFLKKKILTQIFCIFTKFYLE